ncbi:MAG: PaaI family thioesterase [Campylobacteraceae bacterium]|jgi:acyl-CoA thioesterase|nr:PaaI family thioesterase [Campylobacteraceae bacterium]
MKAVDLVKQDKFAIFLGIKILEVGGGHAKVSLECGEHCLNGIGRIQGGVTYTLADYAFALAVNSAADEMEGVACAVGMSTTATFLRAGNPGIFYAEAKEVSKNKTIGHYDVIVSDEKGETVVVFNGVAYFKKDIK